MHIPISGPTSLLNRRDGTANCISVRFCVDSLQNCEWPGQRETADSSHGCRSRRRGGLNLSRGTRTTGARVILERRIPKSGLRDRPIRAYSLQHHCRLCEPKQLPGLLHGSFVCLESSQRARRTKYYSAVERVIASWRKRRRLQRIL